MTFPIIPRVKVNKTRDVSNTTCKTLFTLDIGNDQMVDVEVVGVAPQRQRLAFVRVRTIGCGEKQNLILADSKNGDNSVASFCTNAARSSSVSNYI